VRGTSATRDDEPRPQLLLVLVRRRGDPEGGLWTVEPCVSRERRLVVRSRGEKGSRGLLGLLVSLSCKHEAALATFWAATNCT